MATFFSPALAAGTIATIPRRFTCDGQNVSPPLQWSVPAGAATFAIVVSDPDARGFIHWVVAGIPGGVTGLPEGAGDPGAGDGLVQGRNDFGKLGYGGPCPPSGTHRYVFTLYSFIVAPDLSATPTADEVRRAAKGGATSVSFTALYSR